MADQGEIVHAGRSRIGNESEPVAIRECCHHRARRRCRDRNAGGALNEGSAHLVYRFVRCLGRGDPAPFDMERVDDPQDRVDRPIHSLDAVGNRERVKDTKVLDVKRCGSLIQIDVSASVRNAHGPEYAGGRQPTVPRMRAQLARQAVKSNESKRPSSLDPVRTHKHAIHETHIGMERVGNGVARGQVSSRSTQGEIAFPDETFEVKDY